MGRRSQTETLSGILRCFLTERTWTQAALARELEVSVKTVRSKLEELEAAGYRFERQDDHPHVYWSLPKIWAPGGVTLPEADARELVRHVLRTRPSTRRDELVARVLNALPPRPTADAAAAVTPLLQSEADMLGLCEDAAAQRVPVRAAYFSASSGIVSERCLSIHRLVAADLRCLATDHRSGELRWFRIDRIQRGRLDATEPFVAIDGPTLDAFVRASADGFHSKDEREIVCFFVRHPDARWVVGALPVPMQVEWVDGGARCSVDTAAVRVIARFVTGLGPAATCESARLRRAVAELAAGAALGASERPDGKHVQSSLSALPNSPSRRRTSSRR